MLYLQDRLHPSVFSELVAGLKACDRIEVTIDVPPNGGLPSVDVVRRKRYVAKRGA